MSIAEMTVGTRPIKSTQYLPADEKVKAICETLDMRHRLEFLLDLWRASIEATESGDFFPLIKLIADWEATAEILADKELAASLDEERGRSGEERGRSWDEIRSELHIA